MLDSEEAVRTTRRRRLRGRNLRTAGSAAEVDEDGGEEDDNIQLSQDISPPRSGARNRQLVDRNADVIPHSRVEIEAENTLEDANETDRLVNSNDRDKAELPMSATTDENANATEQPRKRGGLFKKGRRKFLLQNEESSKKKSKDISTNAEVKNAADLAEREDLIDPAMEEIRPEALGPHRVSTACACLYSNLLCRLGYRLSNVKREISIKDKHPELNIEVDSRGLSVGFTVHSMISIGEQLVSIVKPMVKIHAVNIDTGYYIKSLKIPVTSAVCTKPCTLKDSTSQLVWNQELIMDAYFSDLASEKTLLLFELLDDKPSLSSIVKKTSSQANKPLIAKRIAWAYLLPVGHGGELNIGFSDDWKAEHRYSAEDLKQQQQNTDLSESQVVSDNNSITSGPPPLGANIDSSSAQLIAHSTNEVSTAAEAAVGATQEENSTERSIGDLRDDGINDSVSGKEKKISTGRQRYYPWEKPSPDKQVRLQLYHYRQYDGFLGFMQRQLMGWPALGAYIDNGENYYPNGIPEVYVQWRLQRHVKIMGSYLCVSSGPRPIEVMPYALSRSSTIDRSMQSSSQISHILSDAHTAQFLKRHGRRGHVWGATPPKSAREQTRLRSAVMRRSRGHRERCVVPDKLVYRLDAGGEGAMVVAFSTSGHILAIAAKSTADTLPISTSDANYSLRLFDTDLNEEVWVEEAAHHAVIYQISWTRNDRYLLTVSGDGTCKVWDMISLSPRRSNQVGFGVQNNSAAATSGGRFTRADNNNTAASIPNLSPNLQALINKPPQLVHVLSTTPPVFTYSGIFTDLLTASTGSFSTAAEAAEMPPAEYLSLIEHAEVPRIITGAADGRIRVWEHGKFAGYIFVSPKHPSPNDPPPDYSPHEGAVNSLVIDERSRYLITGDSAGDILAWRQDPKGWFQLLRKFKRDAPVSGGLQGAAGLNPSDYDTTGHVLSTGGVQTLQVHPQKHRGQMLALLRQPAQLKMINMSTYKTQCTCEGFVGLGSGRGASVFFRAGLSADGRFVISGSCVKGEAGKYCLQLWDSQTGQVVRSALSEYVFPYPIRSISWHPAQHLLAVAMVGTGAAVVVYGGERESVVLGGEDYNYERKGLASDGLLTSSIEKSAIGAAVQSPLQTGATTTSAAASGAGANTAGSEGIAAAIYSSGEESSTQKSADRALKSERARGMLEKIKAAREKKKQEGDNTES